jgi:exosortase/archaeosortase family protein
MDWKIGLIFLGLGVLLNLPVALLSLHLDLMGWIWPELLLWVCAPVVLVIAGTRHSDPSASGTSQRATLTSIYPCLMIGLASLSWGVYSSTMVWSLRGISIAASCCLVLLFRSTDQRLFQMVALGMLAPVSTWTLAHPVHWIGQKLATALAGSVLDVSKVYHYYKGNVIGLVSTDFLENQQCSGIRLLGTSLLVVLTMGFLGGYSWLRMIYLTVVSLFWIVVWNAMRLAYCVWMQDGQSSLIQHNFILYDAVCLLGILFFTWSADQFISALIYQDKDIDKEDIVSGGSKPKSGVPRSSLATSWVGLLLSVVSIAGILGLGAWQFYGWLGTPKSTAGSLGDAQIDRMLNGVALKLGVLNKDRQDGWVIAQTEGATESFAPVFRPMVAWPHSHWELTNDRYNGSTMRLRIDGLWTNSIAPQWLWQWYGWKTDARTVQQSAAVAREAVAFGMSRSIVEEGYVVTRRLYLLEPSGSNSSYLQVSLVQESVRPISDQQQSLQRDLFDQLYNQIQSGFSALQETSQTGIEAP